MFSFLHLIFTSQNWSSSSSLTLFLCLLFNSLCVCSGHVVAVLELLFLCCRVQYVTSVKLGFATEGSVLAPMPVPAHSPMQNVWNVSVGYGTMVSD